METKKEYTLSIYTENHVGVLIKICTMFSKRKINIDSLNTSPCEIPDIYRFTIVLRETEERIKTISRQIEKIIDVFKVYYNTNEQIIWQQLALYKLPTENIMRDVKVERLLREYGAKAVVIRNDYTVFEVTGQDEEVDKLLKELDKYGLTEFVKSSRIAIIKDSEGIHSRLVEMERVAALEALSN